MVKYDPIEYLKEQKVPQSKLSEKTRNALSVYKKLLKKYEENPDNKAMLGGVNNAGKRLMTKLEEEVGEIKETIEKRASTAKTKAKDVEASMDVLQSNKDLIDELEGCRSLIREENKRKRESGEIPPKKKKTRTTKVKEAFAKILKLMPSDDPEIVEKTEAALRKCSEEIFELNGMNQIAHVVKSLEEVRENIKERLEKMSEKKAA